MAYLTNIREMIEKKTTSYLHQMNYRDMLQLLITEYLIAVSQARVDCNEEKLAELEDVSQFMVGLLQEKITRRDEAAATIDDDLRACSVDKMTAYAQSSETKWNKRPTSAHPAGRPSTAGADAAELPRPGTAPPGMLVRDMRSARELAKQYKADHGKMKKRVEALVQKKEALEKIVKENDA